VVIAGDFNADRWQAAFAQETIFSVLSAAGYADAGALLPADRRGTHPSARWGDSTLDYLYFRGFSFAGTPVVLPAEGLSDHRPVFQLVTPGE
jgi:endonuclease/exonuclease/phosphatase (EEP) superfamily protein YafD